MYMMSFIPFKLVAAVLHEVELSNTTKASVFEVQLYDIIVPKGSNNPRKDCMSMSVVGGVVASEVRRACNLDVVVGASILGITT